jgi:hypothetical protein
MARLPPGVLLQPRVNRPERSNYFRDMVWSKVMDRRLLTFYCEGLSVEPDAVCLHVSFVLWIPMVKWCSTLA